MGALMFVCHQTRYEFLEAVVRIAKAKFHVTTASTLWVFVSNHAVWVEGRAPGPPTLTTTATSAHLQALRSCTR